MSALGDRAAIDRARGLVETLIDAPVDVGSLALRLGTVAGQLLMMCDRLEHHLDGQECTGTSGAGQASGA